MRPTSVGVSFQTLLFLVLSPMWAFLTFDGVGNVSRTGTTSMNGTIIQGLQLMGTYVVNPDCTGSYTLQLPNNISATSNFVIDNRGREIQIINVTNGRVLSGVARKQ